MKLQAKQRSNMAISRRRSGGFTLIELMVSMVAGLVVLGATLAFTVSMIQSHSDNILATRLSQELRTSMALISRELRRAGYDDRAGRTVGQGTTLVSPFAQMAIDADCIIFAYDAAGGTPGVIDNGETKGFRLGERNGVGVVQYHPGGATAPSCDSDTGWEDITDVSSVNVSQLEFENEGGGVVDEGGEVPLAIRSVVVRLVGELRRDSDVERALYSRIRVRADCIRANAADCGLAPGESPAPPVSPAP